MRIAAIALALIIVAVAAASAKVVLGIPVWSYDTVKPNAPFQVHKFYKHPYHAIYVADLVFGAEGEPFLAVQSLAGNYCGGQRVGCLIPASTPRGAFVEVSGTVQP